MAFLVTHGEYAVQSLLKHTRSQRHAWRRFNTIDTDTHGIFHAVWCRAPIGPDGQSRWTCRAGDHSRAEMLFTQRAIMFRFVTCALAANILR